MANEIEYDRALATIADLHRKLDDAVNRVEFLENECVLGKDTIADLRRQLVEARPAAAGEIIHLSVEDLRKLREIGIAEGIRKAAEAVHDISTVSILRHALNFAEQAVLSLLPKPAEPGGGTTLMGSCVDEGQPKDAK